MGKSLGEAERCLGRGRWELGDPGGWGEGPLNCPRASAEGPMQAGWGMMRKWDWGVGRGSPGLSSGLSRGT